MFVLKKICFRLLSTDREYENTSSNFRISLSVVGGGWLGAGLGAGTTAAAVMAAGAAVGTAGTGVGCEEDDGGFNGEEPGLGGSEGWIGELPFATGGRVTGNIDEGALAGAGGSSSLTSNTFASFSGAGEAFAVSF